MHPPSCPAFTHLHEDHVLLTQRHHERTHASTHSSPTAFVLMPMLLCVVRLAITTNVQPLC